MRNIISVIILSFIATSCFNSKYDDDLYSSIYKVNIENRAIHRYGGKESHTIEKKKEIKKIYSSLLSLSQESKLPTKPYKGSILIRFYKKDGQGREEVINILTTGIIFKNDQSYFITYSKGKYVSDSFLDQIMNYLNINRTRKNIDL